MKKLITLAFIATALLAKAEIHVITNIINDVGTTTNVVTNIVHESRVNYQNYAITNGYIDVIGGSNIVYKTVIDSIVQAWTTNGFALVTNSHQVIVSGSETNRVYDIKWRRRPINYDYPITNVTIIVR